MKRALTACPNDDGTVTVKQSGSEVETDWTPETVQASDALTPSEKNWLFSLFSSAKPTSGCGGSCSL